MDCVPIDLIKSPIPVKVGVIVDHSDKEGKTINKNDTFFDCSNLAGNKTPKNIGDGVDSESKDKKTIKSSTKSLKITDLHVEYLNKYLNENIDISNTEARNRLQEETGIKVSVPTVRVALIKLKEERNSGNPNTPLPSSNSNNRSKVGGRPPKLNNSHIEYLKKYLNENIAIGNTEARNRLQEETGIEVSVPTVRLALIKLENEICQDDIKLQPSNSIPKVRYREGSYGFKLKDLHIECLKKYLNEDISIGYTEARNKLQKETGIEVSVPTVWKALSELMKEIDREHNKLPLTTPNPQYGHMVKRTTRTPKLSNSHIEHLKKYLNEDVHIGYTEAKNRLHKETGLKASVSPIRDALINLKKEIDVEGIELHSYTIESKVRSRNTKYGRKLKGSHINCLKECLNENIDITIADATHKLYDKTGLKASCSNIRKVLMQLREEIDPKQARIHSSSDSNIGIRIGHRGYKLKESHIECIKRYIGENDCINISNIRTRLYNETGLSVHDQTIRKLISKLLPIL